MKNRKECTNCWGSKTPQWRKINNQCYCNCCWTYYKRNNKFKDNVFNYAKVLINISRCSQIPRLLNPDRPL